GIAQRDKGGFDLDDRGRLGLGHRHDLFAEHLELAVLLLVHAPECPAEDCDQSVGTGCLQHLSDRREPFHVGSYATASLMRSARSTWRRTPVARRIASSYAWQGAS